MRINKTIKGSLPVAHGEGVQYYQFFVDATSP
jgi:hypothetical protein